MRTEPTADTPVRSPAPVPGAHPRERWAFLHALLVVVAATWMFGGKIWWAKPILCVLVAPAFVLTVWEYLARRRHPPRESRAVFRWLAPMVLLVGLGLVSAAVPNLEPRQFGPSTVWVVRPLSVFWPSSADGSRTLQELVLLAGLYLTGFNLFLCVRSRHVLRGLMLGLAANGLLLSIFGTLQKLLQQDIFFGLQKAPHPAFFATFVYHNHWGAYIVLTAALTLGLVFHYARRSQARDFWHSPACGGIIAAAFMAATVPLSSSRSSTLLIALLLLVGLVHAFFTIARSHRRSGRCAWLVVSLLTFAVATSAAIYKLGQDTIDQRIATTRIQINDMRQKGDIGQRRILYRDTLRMAADKPWFGWGLESYERVFPLYNSTPRSPVDRLPIYYQEAHSDWLQVLAELGRTGLVLLVAAAAWPLAALARGVRNHALSLYPVFGCLLVSLYAWVEFPLANPAVVATWWISWFIALRYAMLSEHHR